VADGHLNSDKNGRRFEALPASAQDHVLKFVAECGLTMTDLRNDVYARTMTFIKTLQLMRPAERFTGRGGSFLVRGRYPDRRGAKLEAALPYAPRLAG
jgi:hypothetical protein